MYAGVHVCVWVCVCVGVFTYTKGSEKNEMFFRDLSEYLNFTFSNFHLRSCISPHQKNSLPFILPIGLESRVFSNDLGDLSSIPGRFIPKTQIWYLIPLRLTLSSLMYVSRVKWCDLAKGVAPSSTPRLSSYWKRSLRVALDFGR